MSKVKCIIRQGWTNRDADGNLLERRDYIYVTNEDGTPTIYNSIKEARAEIISNYGRDANRNGILYSHSVSEYSGNVHDGYVYIVREDSEEYAEATKATKATEATEHDAAEVAPYLIWEDQPETATEESHAAEDAATSLISAYALAIGEYPRETDPEYIAAYHVAADEIAGTSRATAEDLQHVAAMVEAIAEFDRKQRAYISANSLEHYTTPYTVWETEEPETGNADAEPVTLDKFSSEPVDEYGEAYHFIDLTKGTTAYQYGAKNKYLYTIGHSAEFGEWVAEIDDEYGYLAAGQGATRQTALENVCIDAVAADAMRKNPNCEDAVNVIAGEAYHLLNAHYPDTSDPEQREQYARMLEMSTEYVKRYGVFYEIKWEPYQVADADQDATAEAAADAREAWSGEGIYRVMWSDGGQPYEPAYYGSVEDLTSDLLAAYEEATETHLPYAEPISAYHRYELEAYLGEPADYDVDAIEAATTARTAAGLQFWTADAETLAAVAEAYQTAEYIPA